MLRPVSVAEAVGVVVVVGPALEIESRGVESLVTAEAAVVIVVMVIKFWHKSPV